MGFCNDKIISTLGEGGMISTNEKKLYLKLWSLKEIGKDYYKTNTKFIPRFKWTHDTLGSNLRMTEVQAAVGRIQLKALNKMVLKRRKIAKKLNHFFSNNKLFFVNQLEDKFFSSYYRFYFFLNKNYSYRNLNREKIINFLIKKGHDVSVGSCPEIYLEKPFKKILKKNFSLPNAKYLGRISLALSLSHLTKEKEVKKFCYDINQISKKIIQ